MNNNILPKQRTAPVSDEGSVDVTDSVDLLPDVLLAIQQGALDNYIQQLAKACFARRDVLLGVSTLQAPAPAPTAPSRPSQRATGDVVTSVSPVGGVQGRGKFEYKGSVYRKNDLIGNVVYLNDPRPRHSYSGLRARVLRISRKTAVIEWVDKPRDKRAAAALRVSVPLSFIEHVLN